MNNIKNIATTILLLVICFNCNSTKSTKSSENTQKKSISILFIGNSLTYSNNLPKLVKTQAREENIAIKTKMIAFPNYAILDHWNDKMVQEEITSKEYDYIVIQQGPSSQAFGREILLDYGKKYSILCKNSNAKLCLFMVWPSLTYYKTFDNVIKNHREAAKLNDAILLPVGEVWKSHFDTTQNFDYYSSDGFHPSLKGSKVAAKVIIEYLFKK